MKFRFNVRHEWIIYDEKSEPHNTYISEEIGVIVDCNIGKPGRHTDEAILKAKSLLEEKPNETFIVIDTEEVI